MVFWKNNSQCSQTQFPVENRLGQWSHPSLELCWDLVAPLHRITEFTRLEKTFGIIESSL